MRGPGALLTLEALEAPLLQGAEAEGGPGLGVLPVEAGGSLPDSSTAVQGQLSSPAPPAQSPVSVVVLLLARGAVQGGDLPPAQTPPPQAPPASSLTDPV